MRATIVIGNNDDNRIKHVEMELPPEFSGPKYARLRTLEINRLLAEGFTTALEHYGADNPMTDETIILISFAGLPKPERKD